MFIIKQTTAQEFGNYLIDLLSFNVYSCGPQHILVSSCDVPRTNSETGLLHNIFNSAQRSLLLTQLSV